jgi:hypothetical protein
VLADAPTKLTFNSSVTFVSTTTTESGAQIQVQQPDDHIAEALDVRLINVFAKTTEAAMHAKTLVENAVDALDGDGGAIAAPVAAEMQSVLLTKPEQLEALDVRHLRSGLQCYGQSSKGTKKALIARLTAHANDVKDGVEASISWLSFFIPEHAVGSLHAGGENGSLIKRLRVGK